MFWGERGLQGKKAAQGKEAEGKAAQTPSLDWARYQHLAQKASARQSGPPSPSAGWDPPKEVLGSASLCLPLIYASFGDWDLINEKMGKERKEAASVSVNGVDIYSSLK